MKNYLIKLFPGALDYFIQSIPAIIALSLIAWGGFEVIRAMMTR